MVVTAGLATVGFDNEPGEQRYVMAIRQYGHTGRLAARLQSSVFA